MDNKKEKKVMITTIGIIIGIILLNLFYNACKNTDYEFDNSVFWSAISTITSIIGFGGVIYTLIINEKARRKQNDYELKKDLLIEEQNKYRDICYKELENINPQNLAEALKSMEQEKERNKALNFLYKYQINIDNFPRIINRYYRVENRQEYKALYNNQWYEYTSKSMRIFNDIIDIIDNYEKVEYKNLLNCYEEIRMFNDNEYKIMEEKVMISIENRKKIIGDILREIDSKDFFTKG